MKTYKTETIEKYYIYDRLVNKLYVFSSKKKFIDHMVELCVRYYRHGGIQFNDIINEQNLCGNDSTRHVKSYYTHDDYVMS